MATPHGTHTAAGTAAATAALAAAGSAGSAALALHQLSRFSETVHLDQLLHGCLTVVAAALAALLAHLALSWLLIALVRATGPQSALGRFGLRSLRIVAPRLMRSAVTAGAAAASIAALGSTAALAQPIPSGPDGTDPAGSAPHAVSMQTAAPVTSLGWAAPQPAGGAALTDAPASDGGGAETPAPAPSEQDSGGEDETRNEDQLPSIGWDASPTHAPSAEPAPAESSPAAAAPAPLAADPSSSATTANPAATETASAPTAEPAPPVDASETPADSAQVSVYTVQPGDSLWAIASTRLGTDASAAQINALVHAIAEDDANHLADPDLILPGQVLTIPTIDGAEPARH